MFCGFVISALLLSGSQALQQSLKTDDPPATSNGERMMQDVTCISGLLAAGGIDDIFGDVESLGTMLDENSTLTIAQAGTYKGVEEIKEYVNFVNSDLNDGPHEIVSRKYVIGDFSDKDNCSAAFTVKQRSNFNSTFFIPTVVETLIGFALVFKATDIGLTIKRAMIFIPSGSWESLATLGKPDASSERVCSIMEDNCEEVWKANNLNEKSCKDKFLDLDVTDGDIHRWDGNSQGCRVLHSRFAETNPEHCPHISFTPTPDSKDRIKCQTSKETTLEELFSDTQLDFFSTSATEFGLDETMVSFEASPTSSPTGDDCRLKTFINRLF